MNANQVQIPVIQTNDGNLTQVQQNTNKILRNLNNQINELQLSVFETIIIGEIKIANLTTSQFQSIVGVGDWLLCNGQSCVGTEYARITGNNTVPTLTLGSVNNFIRVN